MPTVIDSLIVELGLDPSQFEMEQKRVSGRLAGFRRQTQMDAKGVEDSLKRISDEFEGLVKKALTFVGSLIGARVIVAIAKDITETNRTLGNLADVMQESVQRLSALGNVFERLGASSGSAMDAVANFDRQIKEMKLGTLSPLDSPMMKFLNSISVAGGRVNPYDAKGRFKPALDIFVEAAETISKLNVSRDIKAGLWQQLGLDADTIAVALRGGEALRKHLEEQEKIYTVTPEQRAKTDKLRQQMYELIQRSKSLGQVVLAELADSFGKVLEVMSRFVDFLNRTLQDPTSSLYLPSVSRIKEYFGGKLEDGGVVDRQSKGGSESGSQQTTSDGKLIWEGGKPTGTGYFFPGTTTKLGGGVGGYSASMGAGRHQGDDVMMPYGSPLYAVKDGVVSKHGTDNFGRQTMTVTHADGSTTKYLHMASRLLPVGTAVSGGQVIGSSGSANGVAHLHIEMRDPRGNLMSPRLVLGRVKPSQDGTTTAPPPPMPQQQPIPYLNFRPMSLKAPTISNTTRTDISSVNVNTGATDASAIANDIARELKRQMRESMPSQQLINARTPAEADAAMRAAEQNRTTAEAR